MPVTGTRTEVRNPLPDVRSRGTALNTYLPMSFVSPQPVPRWLMTGVTMPTNGCPTLTVRGEPDEICDYTVSARNPTLDRPGEADCIEFNPFEIASQMEHKFVQDYTRDELVAYVRTHFGLWQSFVIAREAMTGSGTTTSPSLAGEADTVTGVDTSVLGALAAVEDGLGTKIGNGEGMIHLSPGLFTLLKGALVIGDSEIRTVTGHRVVVDAGYTGYAPGGSAPSAGEAWVYGSGPVYLETAGPRFNGQDAEAFVLSTNTGVIHMEMAAVLAFEPCTVVAAMGSTKS